MKSLWTVLVLALAAFLLAVSVPVLAQEGNTKAWKVENCILDGKFEQGRFTGTMTCESVAESVVLAQVSPEATVEPTATPEATPTVVVTTQPSVVATATPIVAPNGSVSVEIQTVGGKETDLYDKVLNRKTIRKLESGTEVWALGTNTCRDWLYVWVLDQKKGWISTTITSIGDEIYTLPIYSSQGESTRSNDLGVTIAVGSEGAFVRVKPNPKAEVVVTLKNQTTAQVLGKKTLSMSRGSIWYLVQVDATKEGWVYNPKSISRLTDIPELETTCYARS